MNAPTTGAPELRDASAMLAELNRRGVALRVNGDRLAIDAPKGAVGDLLPELQRLKPQLLELLTAQPVHRWRGDTATATGAALDAATPKANGARIEMQSGDADERALELLARYRRGGAVLSLEQIEHAGAAWLSLACDLTGVSSARRERAFEQMQRNARQLQRALELEAMQAALPEVNA